MNKVICSAWEQDFYTTAIMGLARRVKKHSGRTAKIIIISPITHEKLCKIYNKESIVRFCGIPVEIEDSMTPETILIQ